MIISKIYGYYFSPTGATGKIIEKVIEGFENTYTENLLPGNLPKVCKFSKDELLVIGFPVYAGRIPVVMDDIIHSLKGEGTPAIIVGVYGNRAYEDCLVEMRDILTENGFIIVGAGAFIGEHSYTHKCGTGRPGYEDLEEAKNLGRLVIDKLKSVDDAFMAAIDVPGDRPYKERKKQDEIWAPLTNEKCIICNRCVDTCPVGIIVRDKPSTYTIVERCIHCCACIKVCPVDARYMDSDFYKFMVGKLETEHTGHKYNEIFL